MKIFEGIFVKLFKGIFPKSCQNCDHDLHDQYRIKSSALNLICEDCRLKILSQTGLKMFAANSYYIWHYEADVEKLIKRYKFARQYRLAKLFAEFTYICLRNHNVFHHNKLANWDYVCTVPSSANSVREKRFNHSAMLGKAIAKKICLPFDNSILIIKRDRLHQVQLNRRARLKNIKNAFVANKLKVNGKNILLIDDVVTTGATLSECSRILYKAGAKKVQQIALARRELYEI